MQGYKIFGRKPKSPGTTRVPDSYRRLHCAVIDGIMRSVMYQIPAQIRSNFPSNMPLKCFSCLEYFSRLDVTLKSNIRSCLVLLLSGILIFTIAAVYAWFQFFFLRNPSNLDSIFTRLWIGKMTEDEKAALLFHIKWNEPFYSTTHPKRIKRLQILYGYDLTDEDFQFVAEFSNLEELYLKECPGITDQSMTLLEHLPLLKQLVLRGTNVTEASIPLIVKLTNLETLWLGIPPSDWSRGTWDGESIAFTDKTLELLKDSNIKKLWIASQTSITDEGLRHILSMHKLENISLMSEFIFTDKSLKILENSNLRDLSIESPTHITDEGLRHILSMRKLKHLCIKSDFISQKGVVELLPYLPDSISSILICPSSIDATDVKPKVIQTERAKITLRLREYHTVP